MQTTKPYVMSLAGLDPSGGAGLLADIKTFEAQQTIGLGVCTALTVQTDNEFFGVEWIAAGRIIAQAMPLLEKFPVRFCKVGLVQPGVLLEVLPALRAIRPGLQFILDPVLKASAGYVFHAALATEWEALLRYVYLLTPNYEEAIAISGACTGEEGAQKMAAFCAVLLKGGHRPDKRGWDTLYHGNGYTDFQPVPADADTKDDCVLSAAGDTNGGFGSVLSAAEDTRGGFGRVLSAGARPKHGSGCVLSAAITALLAKGFSLQDACAAGKKYTLRYLQSSPGLLGHHHF